MPSCSALDIIDALRKLFFKFSSWCSEMASYQEESHVSSSFGPTQCIDRKHTEEAEKILVTNNNIKQEKLSNKEQNKENSLWIHLPQDVLELIMKRLCLKDYLGLREICSPWRATVVDAIARKHCCPLPELPLLVLQSKEAQATLFSLMTECERSPKRPLFKKKQTVHGAVKGWMIVSENAKVGTLSIYLFNPVINKKVSVPSKLYFPSNSPIQGKLYMGKMVASSTPNCYKSDCVLAGLFNDFCHIAFYRLFDKSWTIIETDKDSDVHFMDIEIIGVKLYVKTDSSSNNTLVYDLKDSTNGPPRPKVLATLPEIEPPPVSYRIGNHRHNKGNIIRCLAKDEALEELFLIYMFCNSVHETQHVGYLNIVTEYITPPQVTEAEVFKLDMSKEPNQWLKLDKTKDMRLDDLVVFISGCKSMVMSRASLNSSTQGSIPGNGVYYAFKHLCPMDPWKGFQLGMISFTDSNTKYFSVEKSDHFDVPYPFWLVPSV